MERILQLRQISGGSASFTETGTCSSRPLQGLFDDISLAERTLAKSEPALSSAADFSQKGTFTPADRSDITASAEKAFYSA
jgi:hypothetical protein